MTVKTTSWWKCTLLSGFLELDEISDKASSEHGEEGETGEQGSTKASSPGSSSSMPLPSMLLERKMETLITEWNKSPDMLFTIHPADGSFLVWHVKYLDEFNQGIFRQVQVSNNISHFDRVIFSPIWSLTNEWALTHSDNAVAEIKLCPKCKVTQHSPSLM